MTRSFRLTVVTAVAAMILVGGAAEAKPRPSASSVRGNDLGSR